jgi:imidazolonepropionase-like amidohydrolase
MSFTRRALFSIVALLFLTNLNASSPSREQTNNEPVIAIRDGKILTITKGVIQRGNVIIRGNRIEAVGANVPIPDGARIVDAGGMTVYPGLIDAQTHLGLVEVDLVEATRDLVEPSEEITPQMRVRDALHGESALIPVTRVNGVTTVLVVPAETNTMSGMSSLINLAGSTAQEMILVPDIALHINFGREQKRQRPKFPSTRMGLIAQMRQAFQDTLTYIERKKLWEQGIRVREEVEPEEGTEIVAQLPTRHFRRNLKFEALIPVVRGEKSVILGAHEASDLATLRQVVQEFDLKIILNHITYSQNILDEVARWGVPVLVGPIYAFPKDHQRYDAIFKLPAELHRRGIKFAFQSNDAHNVRNLPYQAGYAVAWGLPYEEAIKALTLYPAEIFGVADRLGSLEPGKLANVVVADGDPLEPRTDVKYVFINGQEIPLDNHQLRLYGRYNTE